MLTGEGGREGGRVLPSSERSPHHHHHCAAGRRSLHMLTGEGGREGGCCRRLNAALTTTATVLLAAGVFTCSLVREGGRGREREGDGSRGGCRISPRCGRPVMDVSASMLFNGVY